MMTSIPTSIAKCFEEVQLTHKFLFMLLHLCVVIDINKLHINLMPEQFYHIIKKFPLRLKVLQFL